MNLTAKFDITPANKVESISIVIAIDGFSGCGKSTTAKEVALRLGYIYIDTGAMYRATTLYFLQNKIAENELEKINNAIENININFRNSTAGKCETYLNGINVEQEIRGMYVSEAVSRYSSLSPIRQSLVRQQQALGESRGVVMDGRDIGTKVFPDAELKVFMTADVLIRAKRRQQELLDKGTLIPLNEIIENIEKRDQDDTNRLESPLSQTYDSILIDTSYITVENQVDCIVELAREQINQLNYD